MGLKGPDGSFEIEYLPSSQHQVQKAQTGHRATDIAAGHQSYQTWPMKSIGSKDEEVVFAP